MLRYLWGLHRALLGLQGSSWYPGQESCSDVGRRRLGHRVVCCRLCFDWLFRCISDSLRKKKRVGSDWFLSCDVRES